ncbi:MAG: tetratricopeptide repeat protein [Chloroflexi bacterium]|nr:tetratricopeptide repeat protein [Chloroflexota bacterium]
MSEHLPHHVNFEGSEPSSEVVEAKRLLRAGQFDEVIALLLPLTAGESDDYMLFEVLGAAYAGKGNVAASLGAFETAAHLNPAHPQTYYNLAQARLQAGDTDGAREAFERSLRVDPTYAKAREALAALLARARS